MKGFIGYIEKIKFIGEDGSNPPVGHNFLLKDDGSSRLRKDDNTSKLEKD